MIWLRWREMNGADWLDKREDAGMLETPRRFQQQPDLWSRLGRLSNVISRLSLSAVTNINLK